MSPPWGESLSLILGRRGRQMRANDGRPLNIELLVAWYDPITVFLDKPNSMERRREEGRHSNKTFK